MCRLTKFTSLKARNFCGCSGSETRHSGHVRERDQGHRQRKQRQPCANVASQCTDTGGATDTGQVVELSALRPAPVEGQLVVQHGVQENAGAGEIVRERIDRILLGAAAGGEPQATSTS